MPSRLKSEDFVKYPLLRPLRNLRKGVGLTPDKLDAEPGVVSALRKTTGRRLSPEEAYDELVAFIYDKLEDSAKRAAMINALNIGQRGIRQPKDQRDVSARRSDYAMHVVHEYDQKVREWEDDAFKVLAQRLGRLGDFGYFEGNDEDDFSVRSAELVYVMERRRVATARLYATIDVRRLDDGLVKLVHEGEQSLEYELLAVSGCKLGRTVYQDFFFTFGWETEIRLPSNQPGAYDIVLGFGFDDEVSRTISTGFYGTPANVGIEVRFMPPYIPVNVAAIQTGAVGWDLKTKKLRVSQPPKTRQELEAMGATVYELGEFGLTPEDVRSPFKQTSPYSVYWPFFEEMWSHQRGYIEWKWPD